MKWKELCKKAKALGFLVPNDYCITTNDGKTNIHTIYYYKDGVINVQHMGQRCFLADHKSCDQMYQLMLLLKDDTMTWEEFCEKYNFGGRESFSYDNYIFCSDGSIWFSKEDNRWRVEENQTPEQMDLFIENLKKENNQ